MTDSIDKIWEDDLLGRKEEAEFLLKFLRGRVSELPEGGRHFVLNVNADWGHGKTFFLDRLAKKLQSEGHIVARVDAWETDYASDPILPVMAAIEDAVSGLIAKKSGAIDVAKGMISKVRDNAGTIAVAASAAAGRGLINRFAPGLAEEVAGILQGKVKDSNPTGEAIEAASEAIIQSSGQLIIDAVLDKEAKSAVDNFRKTESSTQAFKRDLAILLKQARDEASIPLPMFVIVDELDRCRPTYAISLLERIKHLFSVDNVVFITGTANQQLSVAITAVYGEKFDSMRYLHRFFDRTYQLAEPQPKPLIEAFVRRTSTDIIKMDVAPELDITTYLGDVFSAYKFGARDIFQTLDLIHTVLSAWSLRQRPLLLFLAPLACQHHIGVVGGTAFETLSMCVERMENTNRPLHAFRSATGAPSLHSLLAEMLNMSNVKIANLNNANYRDNYLFQWIQSVMVRDFDDSRLRYSILEYPSLLRTAGRLA